MLETPFTREIGLDTRRWSIVYNAIVYTFCIHIHGRLASSNVRTHSTVHASKRPPPRQVGKPEKFEIELQSTERAYRFCGEDPEVCTLPRILPDESLSRGFSSLQKHQYRIATPAEPFHQHVTGVWHGVFTPEF